MANEKTRRYQSQLTMGQSLYAYSAVTAAIRKGQTQL